jgi:hypothetical protein
MDITFSLYTSYLKQWSGCNGQCQSFGSKPSRFGVKYNDYIIKGIRFHTMSREVEHVTQNNGVVNVAEDKVKYYGRRSDIFE